MVQGSIFFYINIFNIEDLHSHFYPKGSLSLVNKPRFTYLLPAYPWSPDHIFMKITLWSDFHGKMSSKELKKSNQNGPQKGPERHQIVDSEITKKCRYVIQFGQIKTPNISSIKSLYFIDRNHSICSKNWLNLPMGKIFSIVGSK